jgi:inosine/xanthosine triphosphatase
VKILVVASKNPVKARAAAGGFRRMFPGEEIELRTVSVESGVAHQPMSEAETLTGAENRARAAAALEPEADYWVGIEGGIEDLAAGMLAYAWVVVLSAGPTGKGRTGGFLLPEAVARLVRSGRELGDANDEVFGRQNSKQQEGAIGLLTGKVMDRTELYEHAMVLALAPVKSARYYESS